MSLLTSGFLVLAFSAGAAFFEGAGVSLRFEVDGERAAAARVTLVVVGGFEAVVREVVFLVAMGVVKCSEVFN